MTRRHYAVHGVTVGLDVPHLALGECIDARLRHFRAPVNDGADLFFKYRFSRDVGDVVPPSLGSRRMVYESPSCAVLYFDAGDILQLSFGNRVRVLCEPKPGTTMVWAPEEERSALWLLSRPVVTVPLIELLKRRGLYSVHAAGVSLGDQAILVAGGSGSGKSTLTVALIRAGFDLLGDDLVFLSRNERTLQIHAFPDEIDVSPASAQWFPELEDLLGSPSDGWPKHRLRAEERYAARVCMRARPAVLVFPELSRDSQISTLEPLTPEAATLRLVANVLLTEPRASQAHLDVLQSLVDSSDCMRLRLGRDLERVPQLLAGLVRR